MGMVAPEAVVVKQANLERTRFDFPLHLGQVAASPHLLIGRISSKVFLQFSQVYS
jgi:hypothetical protein